jgi:hypothetical protein
MALQSTQDPTEMSTRNISRGKGGRCLGLTNLPPSIADCLEIWNLKPSGTILLHSYVSMHCITVLS